MSKDVLHERLAKTSLECLIELAKEENDSCCQTLCDKEFIQYVISRMDEEIKQLKEESGG